MLRLLNLLFKLKQTGIKLLIGLLLFTTFSPQAFSIQCRSVLADSALSTPRSLDTLIERMDILGITISLHEDMNMSNPAYDEYKIVARDQNGDVIGEVDMVPMGTVVTINGDERSLFTSHIDILNHRLSTFQGKGIGAYLYAAASRAIFRLGGVLFSTTEPLDDAVATWERMMESNWVVAGQERNQEFSERRGAQTQPSSYRFDQDLLNQGFFDRLDERTQDEDMVFLRLIP